MYGVIQQLRGENFAIFWPPCMDSFYTPSVDKNRHFLTPTPHIVHVGIEWPLCSMYLFPIELLANFTVILHKKGIQSGVTLNLLVELPKNCIVKACIPNIFLFGIFIQVNWLAKLYFQLNFLQNLQWFCTKRHPIRSDLETARWTLKIVKFTINSIGNTTDFSEALNNK